MEPVVGSTLDAHALEQARIGFAEGGVPVGGAIFRTDGCRDLARHHPGHHAGPVLVLQRPYLSIPLPPGDCVRSVNAQGGMHWLKEQGIDIVDLHSQQRIDLIAGFQGMRPDLWKECIGEV